MKVKKKEITKIEKKGTRKEDDKEAEQPEKGEEVKEDETTFQQAGKKKKELSDLEKWIQEREEGSKWTSFPNYDERAKEINRRILKEERDRESRIERARKEEKSWELLRLCMYEIPRRKLRHLERECGGEEKTGREREEQRRKEEKSRERKTPFQVWLRPEEDNHLLEELTF